MSRHTIKSILNPSNVRYTSSDRFYESNLLVHAFGKYETLGDGECQHTPTYRIGAEDFSDFCLSVAQFLLDNPEADVSGYEVGLDPLPKGLIDFLLTVKHKESSDYRRRYYSVELQKVSANPEKAHDNRWVQIPTWADGTHKSVHGLYWNCQTGNSSLLNRYSVLQEIENHKDGYFCDKEECEPWIGKLTGEPHTAWQAMRAAMEARIKRDWAKRMIEGTLSNLAWAAKRKAELEAEALAAKTEAA